MSGIYSSSLSLKPLFSTLVVGLFLSSLSASAIFAQSRFDSWTIDDGLPQNNINDIIQTSDGYLWFATFNGLVRYDGVRFKTFSSGNTEGIKSSRMMRLFEDLEGNLWIATENSGVIRHKDGVFRTYTAQDGLPDNYVSQMRLLGRNASIVMYTSKGLAKWKDGRITACDPGEAGPFPGYGFPNGRGAAWHIDEAGVHKAENGQVTADVEPKGGGRRAGRLSHLQRLEDHDLRKESWEEISMKSLLSRMVRRKSNCERRLSRINESESMAKKRD